MSEPAALRPESATAQTDVSSRQKRSSAKRRRKIRRIMKSAFWILFVCALAAVGWWYYNTTQESGSDSEAIQYLRSAVRQGPFDVYIYGSGSIAAASQPAVYVQTDGKLNDLRVSVGDVVAKGQILAVLQNDALNDEIASLEYALWNADNTITVTSPGSSVSSIQAPSAGRVMQISAAVGDDALAVYRRLGSVAMLSTDGRMKAAVDVGEGAPLSYGDTVMVTGSDFSREGSVTDLFLQGTRAVVTIVDDTLPLGAPVTVTAQGGTVGQGTLEINKPMAVSAFGGTIASVRANVGDMVHRKQDLFILEDSPISLTVENLRIQREAASEALQEAWNRRENLIVRAPVYGVVATVDMAEGTDMAAGDALCSILEGEDMVLTIAVDELDVVKVAEGQPVNISVDALPELVLVGAVQKIAPVGTSASGVSTYDVKLSFDSTGTGVRPGMNASGQVQVAHTDNTLYVPVEALMTMNNQKYLLVADDGAAPQYGERSGGGAGDQAVPEGGARDPAVGQGNPQRSQGNPRQNQSDSQGAPGGFQGSRGMPQPGVSAGEGEDSTGSLRAVSVGLISDDYAEILSGVSAGEVVLYQNSGSGGNANNPFGIRNQGMQIPMMGF